MISVHTDANSGTTRITLLPNRSADWRQARWLLLLLAIPVAAVAIGWSLAGMWVILPFAGIEFSLVAFFMYHVSRQTLRRQEIRLTDKSITVVSGLSYPERFCHSSRQAARVSLLEPEKPTDLVRIHLYTASGHCELGRFLGHADRARLANLLHQSGLRIERKQWWKAHTKVPQPGSLW